MGLFATVQTPPARLKGRGQGNGFQTSKKLENVAHADVATALTQLNTTTNGLGPQEVETHLEEYGPNIVAKEKRQTWLMRLWGNITHSKLGRIQPLFPLRRGWIPPFRKSPAGIRRLIHIMRDVIEQHQPRPHRVSKVEDVQAGW